MDAKPGFFNRGLIDRKFIEHCHVHNIQMLRDDVYFIRNCLKFVRQPQQESIVKRYLSIWHNELGKEGKSYQKQNLGRFKANTWLREMTLPELR